MPDGEDGELSVTVWQSPEDTSDGRRYVSGFDDIRIDKNSLVITIAFQPRGTEIGMPQPQASQLEQLGAADTGQTEPLASVPAGSTPGSTAGTGAATRTADSSPTSSPASTPTTAAATTTTGG